MIPKSGYRFSETIMLKQERHICAIRRRYVEIMHDQ